MPSKPATGRQVRLLALALAMAGLAACGSDAHDQAPALSSIDAGSAPAIPAAPVPADALEVPPAMTTATQAQHAASPAAAQETLRRYYGAINSKDYAAAYAMWSNGGASSRQSAQAFANGYATTLLVDARIGEPGQVEGAAGARYVQVPVELAAARVDGSSRHYRGSFTLRAEVADGATPEQRQWHLDSADLEGYVPSLRTPAKDP